MYVRTYIHTANSKCQPKSNHARCSQLLLGVLSRCRGGLGSTYMHLSLLYIHLLYVCMYACLPACLPACMHVCMYICMHACMHVCIYVCIYVCMYAVRVFLLSILIPGTDPIAAMPDSTSCYAHLAHTLTHILAANSVSMYMEMYTCIYAYTNTRIHTYIHACMHTCIGRYVDR